MEKGSFAMAKFGLEAKEPMAKRDCGFYMKYIFLFTSLIQFLIILGLVLFMVYGNAQAGTDTHLRLLEEQLQDRYNKILTLGTRNMNLTRALNATLKDKDKLQGLVSKVQRELDKCNSTQSTNNLPQLQEFMYIKMKLAECQITTSLINTSCNADKLQLQRQLDQITLSKKELQENYQKTQTTLAKTSQEHERCQEDLRTNRTSWDFTKTELELLRHESRTLKNDINENLQRVAGLVKQYRCSEAENKLQQLREDAEGLFRWQQDRDTMYVRRSTCEVSVEQCRIASSRQLQELRQRLQAVEKQVRDGQEERKRLQEDKERQAKELEDKRREAAAQAESLQKQLNFCVGSQMNPFFDVPGSRVPGGTGRSGPFPSTGYYADYLKNQGVFGNIGKANMEELQRMLKMFEQHTATLKNSG
ncbi:plasmalemma vesicle-associated protein [Manacus candei]|nr:plasmalemma vesicle-associated protein [Manacus candei]